MQELSRDMVMIHVFCTPYEVGRHGYDPFILHMICFFCLGRCAKVRTKSCSQSPSIFSFLHWCQPPLSFCRDTTWRQAWTHGNWPRNFFGKWEACTGNCGCWVICGYIWFSWLIKKNRRLIVTIMLQRFLVCYFPAIISETVAPNGSVRSRVRGFNNNTSLVEPVHRQNYLLCKIFDKTINAAM